MSGSSAVRPKARSPGVAVHPLLTLRKADQARFLETAPPLSIENWLYKTLNPVMTALLRSPLHGIASGSIALLHFRGRKSGREFVTPLSYTRENDTVHFLSAHSTRWWMNLRGEAIPVSIEIAREIHTGKARLWDRDSEQLRDGVRRFLSALPRDAKVYGIKLDQSRRPVEESLAKAAADLVWVEVELD